MADLVNGVHGLGLVGVLKFDGGFQCYVSGNYKREGDSKGDGDFFKGLHVFGLWGFGFKLRGGLQAAKSRGNKNG